MASVSFALNNRQWAALESQREEGESLNLAAKRIFLTVLEAPEPTEVDRLNQQVSDLTDSLSLLEQRLAVLENRATPAPVSPSRLPAAQRRGA